MTGIDKPPDTPTPSIRGYLNPDELMKALKSGSKWSSLSAIMATCAAGALLAVIDNFDKIYTGPKAAAIGMLVGMIAFPLRTWYLSRKLLDEGEDQ